MPLRKWSELFPKGRYIFYEGNDPDGFVKEMKEKFGIDPSLSPSWTSVRGFLCPASRLDEVYGSGKYPMGS